MGFSRRKFDNLLVIIIISKRNYYGLLIPVINFLLQNQKKAVLVENLILADINKRFNNFEAFI